MSKKPARNSTVAWHTLRVVQVVEETSSDLDRGLSDAAVKARLAEIGGNELPESGGRSPLHILWEQFTATLTLVLIAAAVVSALVEKWQEATAIVAIVLLFALLGFLQEYRSERAMAALKKMTVPLVRVRRDGQVRIVEASRLVPGDIVLLEAGNIIPADLRLVEAVNLRIQESALTGEATAVEKQVAALEVMETPLGDRLNMAYMGSTVVYGRGMGVVVATGSQTELGKLAQLLQQVHTDMTPLQRRLNQAGRWLAGVGVVVALAVGLLARLQGNTWMDVFLIGVSVAVAVVPEGLPAVVTITLALGARRMLAQNALVRRLPSVETLGSVTVICSDKTGTLTENRMKVTVLDVADHRVELTPAQPNQTRVSLSVVDPDDRNQDALRLLLIGGALCNDASFDGSGTGAVATGDPTETALVMAAAHYGLYKDQLDHAMPRLGELPFDSQRKRMTTWHDTTRVPHLWTIPHSRIAFSKGAVDGLLETVNSVWIQGQAEPISEGYRARILATQASIAARGMRVLGVCFRTLDDDVAAVQERDFTFVGCVGIMDPPRAEVKDAVAQCQSAGIRIIMITGDHPLTALNIARQLHIAREIDVSLTGAEFERLDDTARRRAVQTVNVFARVAPEHKLQIVEALQGVGHTVAMTGDGVNDAPALKQADIGIAMGISGTDVSKEAADMVLRDDNFATIVAAVKEGRVIYDNLIRFLKFSIAGNLGKIVVLVSGGLMGMPIPLMPLQLLWLNLLTDGLLGVGLGVEGAERHVMRRPPIKSGSRIFSPEFGGQILRMGLVIAAVGLGIGAWAWQQGIPGWQTMIFTALAFGQVWQALGLRSNETSLWNQGMMTNRTLFGLSLAVVALQLGAIYLPWLRTYLGTVPLSLYELLLCAGLSATVLGWTEIEKLLRRWSSQGQV